MGFDIISDLYLSAVTPLGFVSRSSCLCGSLQRHVFLLKGGTASLRSRLIREAADIALTQGFSVKRVLSSLDDGLLEAAFWDGTAVIDSAPPYSIEPTIPSAMETVVWLDCFDGGLCRSAKELVETEKLYSDAFEQSRRLLFAADELLKDNSRTALCCSDTEKITRQAVRTAKKQLRPSKNAALNKYISHRQFSSHDLILPDRCTLTLIQDINGGCRRLYLKTLLEQAVRCGCSADVFYSPCAPFSDIDMLYFPQQNICFASELPCLIPDRPADSIINSRRFTDREKLSQHSSRLRQNRKAAHQLLLRAGQHFDQVSSFRQKKEEIYNYFLDIAKFDKIRHTLFDKIFSGSTVYQR